MKKQKRIFIPHWEGAVEGYTVNYVNRNMWRFDKEHSYEDVMQECHLVFLRCKRQYLGKIDSPQWFMALYKTALANRFADLARDRKSLPDLVEELPELVSNELPEDELSFLELAPQEVCAVLSLFFKAPKEMLEGAFEQWKKSGGKKIHGNRFLCHVLGFDHTRVDLVKQTKSFLRGDEDEEADV